MFEKLQATVEIDESYVGGKVTNMHPSKPPTSPVSLTQRCSTGWGTLDSIAIRFTVLPLVSIAFRSRFAIVVFRWSFFGMEVLGKGCASLRR
jgi:hypothetical protein